MAKFRMVYLDFWSDPKVVEEMTPEDKYFFLYLLTNPNTTQAGIYKITKKQMAFDTGYSNESINALLDRFQNHHELILYNPSTRELAIKHWGKYNLNRGGKPVIDCITAELKQVHDTTLIEYVGKYVESSSIKALYDTYNDTSTISGQEKEKEEEKEEEEYKEQEEEAPFKTSQSLSFFSTQFTLTPSPFMIDELLKLIDEYTDNWTLKALETALINNNRSLKYVAGILRKWKERGSDAPWNAVKPTQQQTKQGKPQIPTVQSEIGQAVTPERLQELMKIAERLEGNKV